MQIVNYKNLKSARFKFDKKANTIIGENDSGKSNAMTAIRILLDGSYYYSEKMLKESDFAESLGDWKGHWIILSAYFDEISPDERTNEICSDMIPREENEDFLKSYIRCEGGNYGTVTLFIRPQKSKRKALSKAETKKDFDEIRRKLTLLDYEFVYTSRSQMDFTDEENYKKIVGNIKDGKATNPDIHDDDKILGGKVNITEVYKYISVVFIDALRDAETELRKPRNPIRRIVDKLQADISNENVNSIKTKIKELNNTISAVEQISSIGAKVNSKLNEMIGLVYSPDVILTSQIKDDLSSLSRHLTVLPKNQNGIELLGLGHLNMLYVALKLVEFEVNESQVLINIMIIEEPEAHIHTHIQKTLFDNLQVTKEYTQVLMTTHSTHLSEVAEITKINILKNNENLSIVMRASDGLDKFGKDNLDLDSETLTLTKRLERFLDAKRTVLLFSKGAILVEGDGEEILLPNLFKKTMGVSLDELGIGLINVGSVAFQNIACIFDETRLQRYCAIITDSDQILVGAEKCSSGAALRGESRKIKLTELFDENPYVETFYADYTLEVDFANLEKNRCFIEDVIADHYKCESTINQHKANLNASETDRYDAVVTVANTIGKGWYSTVLSTLIDASADIPNYILKAISFVCKDVINSSIKLKMVHHSLDAYRTTEKTSELFKQYRNIKTESTRDEFIKDFCNEFPDDIVTRFFNEIEKCAMTKFWFEGKEYDF